MAGKRKTFHYKDELNDDFAGNSIKPRKITGKYKYLKRGVVFNTAAWVVYRVIATPIAFAYCRLKFGCRFHGLENVRSVRGGFFMYGNHTQSAFDAFAPSMISFPKKCYVVTSADAVSIKGLREIVRMVGGLPLANTIQGMKNFTEALKKRTSQGAAVTIYPEAHIWPFYTGVRHFSSGAFLYPVKFDKPAIAFAVTYRERKLMKNRAPLIDVTVSGPFYPDKNVRDREAAEKLRTEVFRFIEHTVNKPGNVAYYEYIYDEELDDDVG